MAIGGSLDSEAYLSASSSQHGDDNVFSDANLLSDLPLKNEHEKHLPVPSNRQRRGLFLRPRRPNRLPGRKDPACGCGPTVHEDNPLRSSFKCQLFNISRILSLVRDN